MPFEVRVNRATIAIFTTIEEAQAHAREIVRADADTQPEVLNSETGEPVAPAASRASRDDLARKIGY